MKESTRRTVRTALQVLVGLCALAPVLVAETGLEPADLPWLAVALGVAAALARIMALPAVNELLGSVGLRTGDGRHEAGRADEVVREDAGRAPAWVLVALAGVALIITVMLAGDAQGDGPTPPPKPTPPATATAPPTATATQVAHIVDPNSSVTLAITEARNCGGVLTADFIVLTLQPDKSRVAALDPGGVLLEVHHFGASAGPVGAWTSLERVPAGDGQVRGKTVGLPYWEGARVVLPDSGGKVTSWPVIVEGCPA